MHTLYKLIIIKYSRLVANLNLLIGVMGRSPLKAPRGGLPCERETQFRNKSNSYLFKIIQIFIWLCQ